MRVLITNGYTVYYLNVVAFKTEIYDDIKLTFIIKVPHHKEVSNKFASFANSHISLKGWSKSTSPYEK